MSLVKEYGWKITLPGLLSQARSRTGGGEGAQEDRPREPFNERTFHELLVKLMVGDDQVRSHPFMFNMLMPPSL